MNKSFILCMFQTFCQSLIMLRRKGLVPATTLLELCFRLLRCPDKLLRKTLYNYIVSDIKQVNSKHKNARLNSVCFVHYLLYYNSGEPGKHGNLRKFVTSGKLREFEMYSGNSCVSDAIFRDAIWNRQQADSKDQENLENSGNCTLPNL